MLPYNRNRFCIWDTHMMPKMLTRYCSVSDCSWFFLANVEHKINDMANPTVWHAATL